MSTRRIDVSGQGKIQLNYQGENNATEVLFLQDPELLDHTWTLLHQRPGDSGPYTVPLTKADNGLLWTVSALDCAKAGYGKVQLMCTKDDGSIMRTKVYTTVIEPSLGATAQVPKPFTPYVNQIISSASEAKSAATVAEAAAAAVSGATASASAAADRAETGAVRSENAASSIEQSARTVVAAELAVATTRDEILFISSNISETAENAATSESVASRASSTAKSAASTASEMAATATASAEKAQASAEKVASLLYSGAGSHNAIYRGKYLGSAVTDEQWAAIKAGTFEDLYIGDYWTIGGVNYRIAAFDYYLNTGDTGCATHHAVIVPDTCLYNHVMNDTNITTGGYVGSEMYTTNLETVKDAIKSAFSGHVLSHRIYLTNAVANGRPSAGAWCDSEVDLMCEEMVYGTGVFRPTSDGTNVPINYRVEKSQLPLFAHEPSRICNNATWWLRDVVSASSFACVHDGCANYGNASISYGVRPAFCIS